MDGCRRRACRSAGPSGIFILKRIKLALPAKKFRGAGKEEIMVVTKISLLARHCMLMFLLSLMIAGPAAAFAEEQLQQNRAPAANSGLLDGLVFRGPTGTRDMDAHHIDVAVFANGRFRSLACEELGFAEQAYRAERDGDAIRFEAVTVSPRYGTLSWQGVVRNGRLEASYVWVKKGWLWTTQREYWFKAEAVHEHTTSR
jgi:hypothetical protein